MNSRKGVLALAKRVQGDCSQSSSSVGRGQLGVWGGGNEWERTGGKLFRAECLYLDLYDGKEKVKRHLNDNCKIRKKSFRNIKM